jgi:hypothetical protein
MIYMSRVMKESSCNDTVVKIVDPHQGYRSRIDAKVETLSRMLRLVKAIVTVETPMILPRLSAKTLDTVKN